MFNNGENPKSLPEIELEGQLLDYKVLGCVCNY